MRKVKKTVDVNVTFKCNFCPKVAGQALYHGLALDRARHTAKQEGWKWFSDDEWGLICPDCQKERESDDSKQ